VPSSPATERLAAEVGLPLVSLDELAGELDIAIDGADEIDPQGWLVKGRGGAHAREKILAAAARRFVVIASAPRTRWGRSRPLRCAALP
jgi:ribose 5-phosphate isomerase A